MVICFYCIDNNEMNMILNKKLLLTLLLFSFTTSLFEGMIIKLLATCQGSSRQKHIKFVMTLTRAPFQVCSVIVGQNPVYLTLFILYEQYYNDFLFVLFQYFTYMEIFRVVLLVERLFNFFY